MCVGTCKRAVPSCALWADHACAFTLRCLSYLAPIPQERLLGHPFINMVWFLCCVFDCEVWGLRVCMLMPAAAGDRSSTCALYRSTGTGDGCQPPGS